jgi:hypothetical protein
MNGCSGSLVVSGTTNGCAWDFEITVFLTGNRIQMAFYRIGFVGGSPGQVQYDTIDGICCAHYDADDVAFVANGGLSYFDVDAGITLVCG